MGTYDPNDTSTTVFYYSCASNCSDYSSQDADEREAERKRYWLEFLTAPKTVANCWSNKADRVAKPLPLTPIIRIPARAQACKTHGRRYRGLKHAMRRLAKAA